MYNLLIIIQSNETKINSQKKILLKSVVFLNLNLFSLFISEKNCFLSSLIASIFPVKNYVYFKSSMTPFMYTRLL